jgi:chromosome segregation protein
LKEEIKSRVERRSGVDERVSAAEATLAESERLFAELTTALADLTAKRNQLESGVRGHRDRLSRLDQDIANVQAEEQKLAQETSALGDLAALSAAMETAQHYLAQSETGAQASEAAQVAARARLEAARAPPCGSRQARAAARDRGAHHLQDRQRRDQESVAADH